MQAPRRADRPTPTDQGGPTPPFKPPAQAPRSSPPLRPPAPSAPPPNPARPGGAGAVPLRQPRPRGRALPGGQVRRALGGLERRRRGVTARPLNSSLKPPPPPLAKAAGACETSGGRAGLDAAQRLVLFLYGTPPHAEGRPFHSIPWSAPGPRPAASGHAGRRNACSCAPRHGRGAPRGARGARRRPPCRALPLPCSWCFIAPSRPTPLPCSRGPVVTRPAPRRRRLALPRTLLRAAPTLLARPFLPPARPQPAIHARPGRQLPLQPRRGAGRPACRPPPTAHFYSNGGDPSVCTGAS
jgi:hypothetical protein